MQNINYSKEEPLNRVALYLRLSKEDLDKLTKEERSESIKNQERMLREKALKESWHIVDIYIDEDYSGIDINRPEFNRMLKDCASHKIDIVLCKSQSRFSRDMEIIEKYLHNKFIEWNIRFVSLVDNADTNNRGNKKSRQINGLINEWYLEDTSENIRATLKNKKESGLYTGSFAPYGYLKDTANKNHLIIDPVASLVVKKIFELYNSGFGYYKIVNYLNDNKIPCPYDYKKIQGSKIASPSNSKRSHITCIDQKGYYIITNTITCTKKEKTTKIIAMSTFTCDDVKKEEKLYTDFFLQVRKLEPGMRIFVTQIADKNTILKRLLQDSYEYLQELKIGDVIPKEKLFIIITLNELRKDQIISYELEVTVKANSKKIPFYYETQAVCQEQIKMQCIAYYEKKSSWSDRTIADILRNEIYIGNMVQGKYQNISYKNKKTIHLKKDKWIIVANTHEAIIDKELWNEVQERLKKRTYCDKLSGSINPLTKKVYCNICGKSFLKNCGKDHKYEYLICRDKRTKWLNCDNKNSIRLDEVEHLIILEINYFIKKWRDIKILNDYNRQMVDNNLLEDKIVFLKKEKQELSKEIIIKKEYFQQLYEDRMKKLINEEQFYYLCQKYNNDLVNIQEKQKSIDLKLYLLYEKQNKLKDTKKLFEQYDKIDTLTMEVANEWIDKIYIGKINYRTNTREITIIWNF